MSLVPYFLALSGRHGAIASTLPSLSGRITHPPLSALLHLHLPRQRKSLANVADKPIITEKWPEMRVALVRQVKETHPIRDHHSNSHRRRVMHGHVVGSYRGRCRESPRFTSPIRRAPFLYGI